MRIDTAGLFNLYTRFMINKKSSRVEHGIHDHRSDKENQKRFLKHKSPSILETKKKRYIHIEDVKKQQQHLYISTHFRVGIKIIYESILPRIN